MFRHGPDCLRGPRGRARRGAPSNAKAKARPPVSDRSSKNRQGASERRRPPADAPIRAELVKRVRREIADGTYETPEKLEAALERMLDELEQQ